MIFSQTTLLPMLLLIGNTIATIKFSYAGSHLGTHLNPAAGHLRPNLYRRNYTEEEVEKKFLDYLKEPTECMKKCDDPDENPYVPLCSVQPARNSQDTVLTENTFNCICTDKKYLAQGMSCLIRQCGGDSPEMDIALDTQYSMCMFYADIVYPKPVVFLGELCLLDDIPEGTVPTDVPVMKKIWPNYTYAEEWPKQTATTWAPSAYGTPVDLEELLEEGLGRDVDTDPSFSCERSGVEGRDGMKLKGMAALVAGVMGVTVFL